MVLSNLLHKSRVLTSRNVILRDFRPWRHRKRRAQRHCAASGSGSSSLPVWTRATTLRTRGSSSSPRCTSRTSPAWPPAAAHRCAPRFGFHVTCSEERPLLVMSCVTGHFCVAAMRKLRLSAPHHQVNINMRLVKSNFTFGQKKVCFE